MNIEWNKKVKSAVAIHAIVFVLYLLLFLVIPFRKTAAGLISLFGFLLAVVVSLATFLYAFSGKKELVSKIYGYPIYRIAAIYIAVQGIISILITAVSAFVDVPAWIAWVALLLLLGLAAIGIILTDNVRDAVEAVEQTQREAIRQVSIFKVDVAGIADLCEQPDVKKELEKLSEAFRFSDPVSSPATAEAEAKLTGGLAELRELVVSKEHDKSLSKIQEIKLQLAERNRICKMSK